MATIVVRNVPDELVEQIKLLAAQKGISMEQEVRNLLQNRYVRRSEVLERIRQRATTLPMQVENQVQSWKENGRL